MWTRPCLLCQLEGFFAISIILCAQVSKIESSHSASPNSMLNCVQLQDVFIQMCEFYFRDLEPCTCHYYPHIWFHKSKASKAPGTILSTFLPSKSTPSKRHSFRIHSYLHVATILVEDLHSNLFSVTFSSLLYIFSTHHILQKHGIKVNMLIITSSNPGLLMLKAHFRSDT